MKKLFYIFFSPSIRMSRKNIICDDKKMNKKNFYRNKNLFNIYETDVNQILVSKKETYDKKAHLNSSLDIMTMITLEHYV